MQPTPQIGLALSGGGVRGLAHIGVLKVLERESIPIHILTGTSMGGFIGASYAAGLSARELESEALRLSNIRQLLPLLDLSTPRRGLFQRSRLLEYIAQLFGERTFDQLRMTVALVAVDIEMGERVVLNEGSVLEAIRATSAVPGLFPPVKRGDQLLVDGGVLDNLPADAARELGADKVIAVDVSSDEYSVEPLYHSRLVPPVLADTINVLWRTMMLMAREANRRSLESGRPDLLIRPLIPAGVTTLTGFGRARDIIDSGEQAMEQALVPLKEILAETSES
jgi:NTE family protein